MVDIIFDCVWEWLFILYFFNKLCRFRFFYSFIKVCYCFFGYNIFVGMKWYFIVVFIFVMFMFVYCEGFDWLIIVVIFVEF